MQRGGRGRGRGRDKLLDRELVARNSKKNWKSVALDGPEDLGRGGPREGSSGVS